MDVEARKEQAARYAIDTYVRSGMRLGLGSGSTMAYALEVLSEYLASGRLTDIAGVPTSERTAALARRAGIPLTTLEETPELDLCIDGADEVDPDSNLIKGMGGALLREKIVALASREMVVVVDDTKLVDRLGTQSPVPVEVLQFGWRVHEKTLSALGSEPALRRTPDGSPYVTDSGNYIYDCHFPDGISAPAQLEAAINNWPGIIENGLFLDYTDYVVIGNEHTETQVRRADA